MGGKKVEIDPGYSLDKLDYSKTQMGATLGDIASAMAMFGSVQEDLVDVIKEVKTSLNYLNSILAEKNFENDLKTSVRNLTILTQNLNSVLLENKEEINQLLKSGNELTDNVNSFINANKDSIHVALSELNETLRNSKSLITKVNDFFTSVDNSANNLGKAINDKALLEDIKASLQNLKEVSKILLDQLQKDGIKVDANIDLF